MLGPLMTRGSSCSSQGACWFGVLSGLLLGAGLATGCGKQAPATEAPSADMVAGGEESAAAEEGEAVAPVDSLLDSLAQLEQREDELLEAGVDLPTAVQEERALSGRESAVPAGADAAAGRCQRVCDLSTAICDLRDQICGLADEHDNETRYVSACERATLDCERATSACEGCDG